MTRGMQTWLSGALLLVPCLAPAAPPVLSNVYPPAAQRGADNELRIIGDGFVAGKETELVLPFAAEVRGQANHREVGTFTIKPAADTPPGVYPLRVRTPEGISNLRLFAIT